MIRLGHGEAAPDFSPDQGHQPSFSLGLGAELAEQLHVPGVGGLAVEGVVPQGTTPQLLGDEGELQQAQPQAAQGPGELRRPEPARLDPLADRRQRREQLGERAATQARLERQDGPLDNLPDRGQGRLQRFGDREVHPPPPRGPIGCSTDPDRSVCIRSLQSVGPIRGGDRTATDSDRSGPGSRSSHGIFRLAVRPQAGDAGGGASARRRARRHPDARARRPGLRGVRARGRADAADPAGPRRRAVHRADHHADHRAAPGRLLLLPPDDRGLSARRRVVHRGQGEPRARRPGCSPRRP